MEDLDDFEVDDSWEEQVVNLDTNGTGPFCSSAFNLGENQQRCLGFVGVPRKIPRIVLNPPVTPDIDVVIEKSLTLDPWFLWLKLVKGVPVLRHLSPVNMFTEKDVFNLRPGIVHSSLQQMLEHV